MSVTFAPELREAVSAAAAEAGLSLSEWLAQAAEAKIHADGQARILEEAERERRCQGLREFLDEYQAEHGAFTEEEMAERRANSVCRGRRRRMTMSALMLDAGALIAIDRPRLARALRDITVESITREDGMRAGELLGATRVEGRDRCQRGVARRTWRPSAHQ